MEGCKDRNAESQAVEDIMEALGLTEESEETAEMYKPMETPETETAPELPRMMFEEPDRSLEKKQLQLLNEAIAAVERLEEVDFVMESAGVLRDDFLLRLKEMRVNEFEHLVDWAEIAKRRN